MSSVHKPATRLGKRGKREAAADIGRKIKKERRSEGEEREVNITLTTASPSIIFVLDFALPPAAFALVWGLLGAADTPQDQRQQSSDKVEQSTVPSLQ
jgi:hypothetical protein